MIDEERLSAVSGAQIEKPTVVPAASRSRFWRYGPLVGWAVLIFIGSSDLLAASHTGAFLVRPLHWLLPNASEPTLATIHFILRKAGHFTEYAILAFFAARAFRTSTNEILRDRWFWVSLIFVILYSLSDEFHQSFVPSRGASLQDCVIDSVGAMIALIIIWFRGRGTRVSQANAPDRSIKD